jgi:hypothetical protein
MKAKRANWSKIQSTMQVSSLAFLDKSGVNTNLTRRVWPSQRKRAREGLRTAEYAQNTTILSSVRFDGTTVSKFFSGSMKAAFFSIIYSMILSPF